MVKPEAGFSVHGEPRGKLHSWGESGPAISLIVVHHRQPQVLAKMLRSVAEQDIDLEVLVANASPEVALPELPGPCRILEVDNHGYAAVVNQALEDASGEIIVICNCDVVLRPGCLSRAVAYLRAHPDVGVVAPQLANGDGSPQHNGRRFYTWLTALWARCPLRRFVPRPSFFSRYLMADEQCDAPRDVDWLIGALLVVRRTALVHPSRAFDPRYRFYMEDVDFCLDMWQRGWRVVQLPEIMATHLHRRASKKVLSKPGFHHFVSFMKFLLKYRGLPQRAT
ncbi:MAG: glycosyltransferase [Planctomycetes bacterium]|nr:glycosyltransferase [Planctomycetota bacterium]